MATLTFLGAAGTVTGSRHLLTTAAGTRALIDAGLFQGRRELRDRNSSLESQRLRLSSKGWPVEIPAPGVSARL